jgi:hypothetical protein
MSLALFFAQHVLNASTFIFRSLRLCVGILLCKDSYLVLVFSIRVEFYTNKKVMPQPA